jgi:hypothetical protein
MLWSSQRERAYLGGGHLVLKYYLKSYVILSMPILSHEARKFISYLENI